jgi:hypothetical protein
MVISHTGSNPVLTTFISFLMSRRCYLLKNLKMKNLRKLLLSLWVTEKVVGEYGYERHRLNPYNPLSYLLLVIVFISGIVCFGVVGFWREVDLKNPFKYN